MTTDIHPNDIKAEIAAGIATGLAFEREIAFRDARHWLLAELQRMRDSTNAPKPIQEALDVVISDIAHKESRDCSLHLYSIYLEAFEAHLTGSSGPRTSAITVEEKLAMALGALDANSHGSHSPTLTGRFEFMSEGRKLLHEDDVKSEGS